MNRSNQVTTERLVRLPEVLTRFPVSKSSWYAGMVDGRYPKPVRLGPKSVAWRERDIDALIETAVSTADVAA